MRILTYYLSEQCVIYKNITQIHGIPNNLLITIRFGLTIQQYSTIKNNYKSQKAFTPKENDPLPIKLVSLYVCTLKCIWSVRSFYHETQESIFSHTMWTLIHFKLWTWTININAVQVISWVSTFFPWKQLTKTESTKNITHNLTYSTLGETY